VFTSGGTEGNNLAVFGLPGTISGRILVSPIEHPSITEPLGRLADMGSAIDRLPVDSHGLVHAEILPGFLRTETRLAAVMLANHETGAVQPIRQLVEAVGGRCPFHCDAVQAVGRIPVRFHDLGVTTLALSAHKFHGPKGIGALLTKRGTKLQPLLLGGPQQRGRRPGTEPVALVVGLATALELAEREGELRRQHVRTLRERFLSQLREAAAPVVLNGPEEGGVPHTVNLSFPGCRAEALLMRLDLEGVACSTGSACSSGSLLPSPVLSAMGVSDEVWYSAMRFSLSTLLTETDIDEAVRRIVGAVRRLRAFPS
jgi:cysteine desulfurase